MLAIIPARGGSKGLPGKNIRHLGDKPLIAYTVEAALKSTSIDRVIVSTDSDEIADVSRKAGAEVPFIRPADLATDEARAQDVYVHACEFMESSYGIDVAKFVVLLPTSPFRKAEHIDEAVSLLRGNDAETVISVCKANKPATWFLYMDRNGYVVNCGFDKKSASGNRQQNMDYYIPNGAIYVLDYLLLKHKGTYYSENTIGYEMDRYSSIDIDCLEDLEYAEFILNRKGR